MAGLPTRLKGHHVPPLAYPLTREEWSVILQGDYPGHEEFAAVVHGTYAALREHPSHRVRVIEDGPDVFCDACPKRARCYAPQHRDSMIFLDRYFLKGTGVATGKEYAIEELLQQVDPTKWASQNDIEGKLRDLRARDPEEPDL